MRASRDALIRDSVLMGPGLTWLAALLAVPCGLIFVLSFIQRGDYGGVVWVFTLDNYVRAVEPLYLGIMARSLLFAFTATLIALVVGYPAAFAIARAAPRWQVPLLILAILPFWSNYLIRTYAWMVLLNREGLINSALEDAGLISEPLPLLYNGFAIILGLVYAYLPFMILALYTSISRVPRDLLEASGDLGASGLRTFIKVLLPLTVPGIAAGSVFVFVLSLGNFVTPDLLGGKQTAMIGNVIYAQFFTARDWPFGSALAFLLVAVMMALLLAQAAVVRRMSGGAQ
jgi:spermidine/putrescine transport system permease protein